MSVSSYGSRAVGLDFDPSADADVARIKGLYAEVIDLCHAHREHTSDPERKRLYSIAITEAQTAQMWTVKAVTWR